MNKAEFATLLENPANLGKTHLPALKSIVADFPYFQAGHMLLSRALFNENHYEFEKQLRSTALIVTDREQLFRYIHDVEFVPDQPTVQTGIDKLMEETAVQPIVHAKVEEVIPEPPAAKIPTPPAVAEPPVVVAEEPLPAAEPPVETAAPVESFHSFSEWLELSRKGMPPVEQKEPVVQVEKPEAGEKTVAAAPVETTPVDTGKSNIAEFESILDKFIRENPSISRPKAEFYNPVNVARHSVQEDEELVTETLANIYYKQGAHKKAIRAYEKLCLIYPHKMAYFADLIKKIKEESKND